ncbi:DNAse I-like superfamily protein [Striga asiatica]|uniref:DNAse I-like superfamily protein n=1 Tax=Striga asiatica TaxID=4170 RepID=A0A5A7QBI7_STRAF|nr:DNAse I-like superfamily protein [Striga asiatica]
MAGVIALIADTADEDILADGDCGTSQLWKEPPSLNNTPWGTMAEIVNKNCGTVAVRWRRRCAAVGLFAAVQGWWQLVSIPGPVVFRVGGEAVGGRRLDWCWLGAEMVVVGGGAC